jgi:peptidoglycan/LPS O-acetylase OafA/YrhL
VNTAANPRSIVPVGERWFDYPGVISYGVYMYHMVAVYATTWIFLHTTWWKPHLVAYELVFYLAAAGLTLLLAHASYQFFEKRFLTLKDRRFASLAAPLPHEATPPRRSFSIAADWTSDR